MPSVRPSLVEPTSGIGAKLPRRTAPGDRPPWRNPGATLRIRRQSQRHVRNQVTWVTNLDMSGCATFARSAGYPIIERRGTLLPHDREAEDRLASARIAGKRS